MASEDMSPSRGNEQAADEFRAQRLESLGALAAGAAHDFNNVLGIILGYVELARMGLGDEHAKVKGQLEKALATVARVRELSDSMLEFARTEPRRPDVAEPASAVEDAAELLRRSLDARVVIHCTLDPEAPCVPLDREALRQVVVCLGLEAAQAMPEGGRIAVAVARTDVPAGGALRAGTYVSLTVSDEGPAVAGARGARAGQGLPVARGLVERFGGGLTVAGEGAIVSALLPHSLATRLETRLEGAAPAEEGHAHAADPAHDGSILIVDSDPAARDVLRSYLEGAGHAVREAGAAAEAEALFHEAPGAPRLVLIDDALGDGPGADLAWRIAALPAAPSIVFMTGRPDTPPVGTLPAGAHVLPRPFLLEDLTAVLREALGIEPG